MWALLLAGSRLALAAAVRQPACAAVRLKGSSYHSPSGSLYFIFLPQVQSVAQLGVHLLLFTLGLEFSLTKLRAVRNVALFGGLLQVPALFAKRGDGCGLQACCRCLRGLMCGGMVVELCCVLVLRVAGCRDVLLLPPPMLQFKHTVPLPSRSLLQTALFAALAGLGAKVIGTNAAQVG